MGSESPKVHFAFQGPGVPGLYPACGSVALLVRWHDDFSMLTCVRCRDRLHAQGCDQLPSHREIAQRLQGVIENNNHDDPLEEHLVLIAGGIKLR